MISIQHLTKTYPDAPEDERALDDVSLEIPDGDVYGIIGISGAGKSTLVRCINLLERPTSGSIVVDGTDVTALTDGALRAYRWHGCGCSDLGGWHRRRRGRGGRRSRAWHRRPS